MMEKDKNYWLEKQRKITKTAGLSALIIIPLYSILFALKAPLLDANLSKIGGVMGYLPELIVWGVITTTYFLFFFGFMFKLIGINDRRVLKMLLCGCLSLLLTVLVPYSPDVFPKLAGLHNFFAYGSVLFLVETVYCFLYAIKGVDRKVYKKLFLMINSVIVFCLINYFESGVTSLIEISLTIGIAVALFCSFVWLQSSERFDMHRRMEQMEQEHLRKEE